MIPRALLEYSKKALSKLRFKNCNVSYSVSRNGISLHIALFNNISSFFRLVKKLLCEFF